MLPSVSLTSSLVFPGQQLRPGREPPFSSCLEAPSHLGNVQALCLCVATRAFCMLKKGKTSKHSEPKHKCTAAHPCSDDIFCTWKDNVSYLGWARGTNISHPNTLAVPSTWGDGRHTGCGALLLILRKAPVLISLGASCCSAVSRGTEQLSVPSPLSLVPGLQPRATIFLRVCKDNQRWKLGQTPPSTDFAPWTLIKLLSKQGQTPSIFYSWAQFISACPRFLPGEGTPKQSTFHTQLLTPFLFSPPLMPPSLLPISSFLLPEPWEEAVASCHYTEEIASCPGCYLPEHVCSCLPSWSKATGCTSSRAAPPGFCL